MKWGRGVRKDRGMGGGRTKEEGVAGPPCSGTIEQDSFSQMRRAKEDFNIMPPPLLFFLVSHFLF